MHTLAFLVTLLFTSPPATVTCTPDGTCTLAVENRTVAFRPRANGGACVGSICVACVANKDADPPSAACVLAWPGGSCTGSWIGGEGGGWSGNCT